MILSMEKLSYIVLYNVLIPYKRKSISINLFQNTLSNRSEEIYS